MNMEGFLWDCGNSTRDTDSTRNCRCVACNLWWAANIDGYFFCPRCLKAVTPLSDQYNGLCEQCFDEKQDELLEVRDE
jgi:hypothetical protein